MNLQRVLALASKEWRELRRDRIFFTLAFLLPILLMFVFGHAMGNDVEHVPFAIVDEDRTAFSRDYSYPFIASRYFAFRGYCGSLRDADPLLDSGAVRVVLVIPARFEERLAAGRPVEVQALLDGTFTNSIRLVKSYVQATSAAASEQLLQAAVARRQGGSSSRAAILLHPLRIEVRYLYNQEVKTIWAIAPALIMLILTLTAPMLTAIGVVREKETGSIYNIYASTITRAEYLAGKLFPYVVISFTNGILLFLIATAYFRAPFKGSLPFFLLVTFLYVLCCSSMGLLLSLVVRTQQAALMVSVIGSMLLVTQFGGMFTPIASLTGPTYYLAHLVPPMYYNEVIEGAFLKGLGGAALWRDALILAVYAGLLLVLGHHFFRKRTSS